MGLGITIEQTLDLKGKLVTGHHIEMDVSLAMLGRGLEVWCSVELCDPLTVPDLSLLIWRHGVQGSTVPMGKAPWGGTHVCLAQRHALRQSGLRDSVTMGGSNDY